MIDPNEVFSRVDRVIQDVIGCSPDKIKADALMIGDLGYDSLDAVEIVMAIEDEFGVSIEARIDKTVSNEPLRVRHFRAAVLSALGVPIDQLLPPQ